MIELHATAPNTLYEHHVGDPLITTKLRIPMLRSKRVARPALTALLEDQGTRKLTLLCAPAGSGKTTLLSEWAAQNESPTAWLDLETHDNQLERYWAYFITALQSIQESVGENALAMLYAQDYLSSEHVLTNLINDIANLSEPLVLILDNYHLIQDPSIHRSMSFLLDHLPSQLHLFIGSRMIPSLPLARLRGLGQITELYSQDLRFTAQEIEILFNEMSDFDLSLEGLKNLENHTEGWITGLQLLALTLPKHSEQDVISITGSHRHIADFFSEEVFDKQSPEIQEFLLFTSVLNEFDVGVCDALIEGNHSKAILDTLERENTFLITLDETRQKYRYHRLFAEFLRNRLRGLDTERVNSLHRKAAEWYIKNGSISEAINHSIEAREFNQAARLAEQDAESMWMRGQIITLRRWLEALPEDLLRSRPRLCLFHAWALFFSENELYTAQSRVQDAERCLSANDPALPQDDIEEIRGMITTIQAAFGVRFENVEQAIERSQKALAELPQNNTNWLSAATLSLGVAYGAAGDVEAAQQALAETGRLAQISGHQLNDVVSTYNQGRIQIQQGGLQQAAILFRQAIGLAEQYHLQLPIAGTARIGLGHLFYEWNNLGTATETLMEGIQLSKTLGNVEAPVRAYICLAQIKRAQHDNDAAVEYIQMAEHLARRANQISFVSWIKAYQARLQMMQGNLEAAARWARRSDVNEQVATSYLHENELLNLARIWIALGNIHAAQDLLSPLLQSAEVMGRGKSVIETLVLQAMAFDSQDDMEAAITTLRRALALAEPGGFVRLFADEGKPMSILLRHTASRGISPHYVSRLLGAFEDISQAMLSTNQPLIDPLSERELEVLHLITQGLSNHEIASELFVAISTVKTHVKSIYRKLNVGNRFEAIERVRDLSLLSNGDKQNT